MRVYMDMRGMDKIIEAAVLFRVSGFRDTPELRNRPLNGK